MPGVQKPHCRPCISRNPSCSACSVPSGFAMPSIVRMSAPFACTANIVQDFTDLPSRSTVQAPQWLVSQPICGPVRFNSSRRKWMSRVRGSTSASTALPFTFIVTWVLAMLALPFQAARAGARQRAGQHHAGHLGAIGGRPAIVGSRRGDRLGGGDGVLDGIGSSVEPTRILTASSAQSGVSATLVSADRAARDRAAGPWSASRPRPRSRSRRPCA